MALEWQGDHVRLLSVMSRGKAVYEVRYFVDGVEKRKRVPKGEQPKDYALSVERSFMVHGTVQEVRVHVFGDCIAEYIKALEGQVQNHRKDSKHGRKISPGTLKKTMVHLNKHIIPFFKKMHLSAIRPSTVEKFQEKLLTQMMPQTANQVKNTLGRAMSFFVVQEYIELNPCREVRALKEELPEGGPTPTLEEVRKVLMHCSKTWHELLIRICTETGVRCGEALALEWSNVRNDILYIEQSVTRQEINTRMKTKNAKRKVKISAKLALALKEYRVAQTGSKFLFLNTEGNLLTSSDALNQALHPACARAGVRKFGWHGLRRLAINTLLDRAVLKDHVQKVVGHAIGSRVTDKHYREIKDEDVLRDDYVIAL